MVSPENSSRMPRYGPTMRGSSSVPAPVSGTRPRRTNTHPNRAEVVAMRTSHCVASSTPRPTAGPSTAAITGFGHATIDHGPAAARVVVARPRGTRSDRSASGVAAGR